MHIASSRPSRAKAFTLVELLVVIGIIALLISILLPALGQARKQGRMIKCLANMRSIGQVSQMYSSQFKGTVLPTIVWGPSGKDDSWAILLVAMKYIEDPQIAPSSEPTANSILVCPEARSALVGATPELGLTAAAGAVDGYERRQSYHVQPGLIVDYTYGINGSTYKKSEIAGTDPQMMLASSSISNDPAYPCWPLKKLTQIKNSTDMVLLWDGVAWNPGNNLTRISGGRHGTFNVAKPLDTGITNLLFLDGHAESAQRADLPSTAAHITGNRSQMRSQRYVFNLMQQ